MSESDRSLRSCEVVWPLSPGHPKNSAKASGARLNSNIDLLRRSRTSLKIKWPELISIGAGQQ